VAVADAFDAMTSTRSYRRGKPVGSAVAELQRCAGTQFDPLMVRALARALDRQGWSPAVTADGPSGNVPAAREQAMAGAGGARAAQASPGERPHALSGEGPAESSGQSSGQSGPVSSAGRPSSPTGSTRETGTGVGPTRPHA